MGVQATLRQVVTMGREGLGGGAGKYMRCTCNAPTGEMHLHTIAPFNKTLISFASGENQAGGVGIPAFLFLAPSMKIQ